MTRMVLVVVVGLTAFASIATAQEPSSLALAESAYRRGALRDARRRFEATLVEPGHERDELVRIHYVLGLLTYASGGSPDEHFAVALALDPTLATPSELAPADRARFEALRPAHALMLELELPSQVAPDEGFLVACVVAHAPRGLVDAVIVRAAGLETSGASDRITLEVPAGTFGDESLTVTATALDEHGGVLARTERAVRLETRVATAPEIVPAPNETLDATASETEAERWMDETDARGAVVDQATSTDGAPLDREDEDVPPGSGPDPLAIVLGVGGGVLLVGGVVTLVVVLTAEPTYVFGAPSLR